jgi:hypothetical protein
MLRAARRLRDGLAPVKLGGDARDALQLVSLSGRLAGGVAGVSRLMLR